jgi:iron uptake system component EfeO
MLPRILPALVASGAVLIGVAACGSDNPGSGNAGSSIEVKATDTECAVAPTQAPAGTVTFKITNNGTAVTEFYVYGEGDKVLGEVENIAPGLSREFRVDLAAGTYETACKPGMTGNGIRGAFTVTGSATALGQDPKVAAAIASYQEYVRGQTDELLAMTQQFVDAVKAGDVARAKALYAVARTPWERIEPVAEIFGDLDPKIDGRENDIEEGMEFTGFHAIERDLWQVGDISASGPMADRLMADVREIVRLANDEELRPLQLANGAKELLDEVASGKITGEEDRYSHTDLWDFDANVEGSKAVITALRPVLEERDPTLLDELDKQFGAVAAAMSKHRVGEGWRLHDELTQAELKVLSDAINALGEPVSRIAAVVSN